MRGIFYLGLLCLYTSIAGAQTNKSESSGPCSPPVAGHGNYVTIRCEINSQRAKEMQAILNKILANQLDPHAVMQKLDDILTAVNPNRGTSFYYCGGTKVSDTPAPGVMHQVTTDSEAEKYAAAMTQFANAEKFQDLIAEATPLLSSYPDWLTPKLFLAYAYKRIGQNEESQRMLNDYLKRKGPAYDQAPCSQLLQAIQGHP